MLLMHRLFFGVQLMNIIKSGPTEPLGVGEPLTFTIRATFDARGPFTNAVIVDDLPPGLLPGTTPATWIGSNSGAGVLRGSKLPPSTVAVGFHSHCSRVVCAEGLSSWVLSSCLLLTQLSNFIICMWGRFCLTSWANLARSS